MTDHEQFHPFAISIAECRRITGLSRTEIYRRLAAHQFHAVKAGNRTLVLYESLIKHLKTLPAARFRGHPPG